MTGQAMSCVPLSGTDKVKVQLVWGYRQERQDGIMLSSARGVGCDPRRHEPSAAATERRREQSSPAKDDAIPSLDTIRQNKCNSIYNPKQNIDNAIKLRNGLPNV